MMIMILMSLLRVSEDLYENLLSRIKPEFRAVMPTIDKTEHPVFLFTAVNERCTLGSVNFSVVYLMTLPFNKDVQCRIVGW
jgi:hypothetical protein